MSRTDKKKIVAAVESLTADMRRINRELFENPELNYQETFATKLLTDYLADKGFAVKGNEGGLPTSFRARHKGKGKGPNVAIIAEYDALPNIGHACGHSLIGASSCAAAVALKMAAPQLPGALTVIGTPAEEGGGGKVKMIEQGVFKDIDAAIMVHPSNKTRVVARMYAITDMQFTFKGKASHAAAFPDQGINALDAGVLFYNAVSAMRQQMKEEARVHGIFTHGGDAPNIIPEKVVMRFYVRALTVDYFNELKTKIVAAARGAAKSAGCRVVIKNIGHTYMPFTPNVPMGELFRSNLGLAGVTEEDFGETEEIGSSDIGNLSQVVPALHPEYAIGDRRQINHSRPFLDAVMSKRGERAMIGMTKAMALTVYDLLTDRKAMAAVKAEFAKQK